MQLGRSIPVTANWLAACEGPISLGPASFFISGTNVSNITSPLHKHWLLEFLKLTSHVL